MTIENRQQQEQLYKTKDISIRDYFQLEDTTEFDIFIDSMKPSNRFEGGTFNESKLTFDQVEYIKNVLREPTIIGVKDMFVICFRLRGDITMSEEEQFFNASVFEMFAAKKYIQDFFIKLIEREQNSLVGIPDDKMLAVNGYERLAPFSHQLTKMQLAERFGKEPHEIGKWRYDRVFNIMVSDKVSNDIQREKANIK